MLHQLPVPSERHVTWFALKIVDVGVPCHVLLQAGVAAESLAAVLTPGRVDALVNAHVASERALHLETFPTLLAVEVVALCHDWLVGWFYDWLVGWFYDWLVGWFYDWLVG